jgi:hypothetical protein
MSDKNNKRKMVLPAELNYDDFITDLLDCGY